MRTLVVTESVTLQPRRKRRCDDEIDSEQFSPDLTRQRSLPSSKEGSQAMSIYANGPMSYTNLLFLLISCSNHVQ